MMSILAVPFPPVMEVICWQVIPSLMLQQIILRTVRVVVTTLEPVILTLLNLLNNRHGSSELFQLKAPVFKMETKDHFST
jgi:hypothetical protein